MLLRYFSSFFLSQNVSVCWQQLDFKIIVFRTCNKRPLTKKKWIKAFWIRLSKWDKNAFHFIPTHTFDCNIDVYVCHIIQSVSYRRKIFTWILIRMYIRVWNEVVNFHSPFWSTFSSADFFFLFIIICVFFTPIIRLSVCILLLMLVVVVAKKRDSTLCEGIYAFRKMDCVCVCACIEKTMR